MARKKKMSQTLTRVEDIVKTDHNGNRTVNPLYWCAANIYVDGDPMEIVDRHYMHGLYAHDFPRMVLYTGRQVGKSLFLATQHIFRLVLMAPFRSIYVAPRTGQTRDWSNDKMKPILEGSPSLRYLVPSNTKLHSWRVFDKDLTNGSQWKGRYAYLNADAARGISGDLLSIDEIQDMMADNVPVLQECLSYRKEDEDGKIKKKYFIYSGTPKTSSHTLEAYWNISDKREWVVRCQGIGHCGTGNILGYDNVGKDSLVCTNCGKTIYPRNGRWVVTNPGAKWAGFRIPQIMTPWTPILDPSGDIEDIQTKMKNYTIQKFLNECIAVSYDEGSKPISPAELYGCCDEQMEMMAHPCEDTVNRQIFAGIDWGGGTTEFPSYTVLAIGAWWHPQQFQIFYIKKFDGMDSDIKTQPHKIIELLKWFGVRLVTTDWGYGAYQNKLLIEAFGNQKVMELQYVAAKEKLKYSDTAHRMMGDRTMLMQDLFRDIQLNKIKFFKKDQFETFGQDFLNIYTDYNEKRQTIRYDHNPTQPDDCAHAVNYCLIAGKYHNNQLKR